MLTHLRRLIKTLRRTILVLAVIAAFNAFSLASASAHNTRWSWTPDLCKQRLVVGGVTYDDGRFLDVVTARCIGDGRPSHVNRFGQRLYKHFVAVFRGHSGGARCGTFHVTGKYSYRVSGITLYGIPPCQF
jgi:hypothetical protein